MKKRNISIILMVIFIYILTLSITCSSSSSSKKMVNREHALIDTLNCSDTSFTIMKYDSLGRIKSLELKIKPKNKSFAFTGQKINFHDNGVVESFSLSLKSEKCDNQYCVEHQCLDFDNNGSLNKALIMNDFEVIFDQKMK